jgi:tetratricopeptide (TPR) repeat protein
VAELSADARIRDLERRLDMDPGSRLFVSLAEEYRKLGRFKQALSALQKGLLAHPGYVAAQVALGRVYVEVGQSTDAIATFTKVLVADPGNLVASKSLAEIYLGRGDKLEALKKLKLYRALSGDRKVDEAIAGLEAQVEPRPPTPTRQVKKAPAEPPPAPKFHETDKSRRRSSARPTNQSAAELTDAFEITSLEFHPGDDSGGVASEDPFPFVPTRDTAISTPVASPQAPFPPSPAQPAPTTPAPPSPAAAAVSATSTSFSSGAPLAEPPAPLAPPPLPPEPAPPSVLDSPTGPMVLPVPTPPPAEIPDAASDPFSATHASSVLEDTSPSAPPVGPQNGDGAPQPFFRQSDEAIFGEVPALFQNPEDLAPEAALGPKSEAEAPAAAAAATPSGRALADLYYSQGHYAEALQIYDDLVTRHPFDEELMRMRRDAEARLLPAGQVHSSTPPDPGVERRRARIRVLERFLSRVQA